MFLLGDREHHALGETALHGALHRPKGISKFTSRSSATHQDLQLLPGYKWDYTFYKWLSWVISTYN